MIDSNNPSDSYNNVSLFENCICVNDVQNIVKKSAQKTYVGKGRGKNNGKQPPIGVDWLSIDGIVFGIANNERLIDTICSYKKLKIGLGYAYVESSQYMSIIIKHPGKYPIVTVRVPILYPASYVNEKYVGIIFSFPIDSLYVKDSNGKNKMKQHIMYLVKGNNDNYTLFTETVVSNEKKKSCIENITKSDGDIVNTLLKSSATKYINTFSLDKTTDLSYTINNMTIIMLKKLKANTPVVSFDQLHTKQDAYLVVENEALKYVVKSANKRDERMIMCAEDSIIWPSYIAYNGSTYYMHEYAQMFKISHYACRTSKESVYYLFATFLNTHVFVILITDQEIDSDKASNNREYSYQDLFNKETQILEIYLLIEQKQQQNNALA